MEPMLPETMEVPGGSPQMIGSVEKADAKGSSSKKGLKSLKELPKAWWREAASDRGGYQWITELTVMDRVVKTLWTPEPRSTRLPRSSLWPC